MLWVEGRLFLSLQGLVKNVCDTIESLMKNYGSPLHQCHLELEAPGFLSADEIKRYRMLIGCGKCGVSLWTDLMYFISEVSQKDKILFIPGCLSTRINNLRNLKFDWIEVYPVVPPDMPELQKEKPIRMSSTLMQIMQISWGSRHQQQ